MKNEQTKLDKPVVVSRLKVGDILILHNQRLEIITLPESYQRNTVAAFKVATVKDVTTGEQSEMKLYANQKYFRVEG